MMIMLTCQHHPTLRWTCKEQAITNGRYNGLRNLFFQGTVDDLQGPDHSYGFPSVPECSCPASDLRIVPPAKTEGEHAQDQNP